MNPAKSLRAGDGVVLQRTNIDTGVDGFSLEAGVRVAADYRIYYRSHGISGSVSYGG